MVGDHLDGVSKPTESMSWVDSPLSLIALGVAETGEEMTVLSGSPSVIGSWYQQDFQLADSDKKENANVPLSVCFKIWPRANNLFLVEEISENFIKRG